MDNVWLWICDLPNSPEWSVPGSNTFIYPLATSNKPSPKSKTSATDEFTIELRAERSSSTAEPAEDFLTFSINFSTRVVGGGSEPNETKLWSSEKCPLSSSSGKPFLPLILQLLQEIIDLSSSTSKPPSTNHHHHHQKLTIKPDPVEWILTTHSPESLSGFFSLIFLTRLFWLCAFNAQGEVGFIYFQSTFPSRNLDLILSGHNNNHTPAVLRAFFLSAGIDIERCIARAVGYMLVKCLIMKEMRVGLASLSPALASPATNCVGLAYATEAQGLWILKTHTPVWAMRVTRSALGKNPFLVDAKESALRYSLAHQQLEAVIQLEYSVRFREDYIQVTSRVDNIRLHLAKLGFQKKDGDDDGNTNSSSTEPSYGEELYFPSRVQTWVGPEMGSSYVSSLTLGKSTGDTKREVEMERVVRGNLGKKMKAPKIKATSRTSTRAKIESWRWDQDADGNSVMYDGVLHDPVTGAEVYKVDVPAGGGTDSASGALNGLRKRYAGFNRLFTKSGSLVFGGGECGEEVKWRLNKDMEGSVVKWIFGGKVWLSYWPSSEVGSKCFETRCVEVCHEVDLPLLRTHN